MLHAAAQHRGTTPAFISSSGGAPSSRQRCPGPSSSRQRPQAPHRSKSARCTCLHKEYARQGASKQQQQQQRETPVNAVPTPSQQLLSVPEDIVLECLTIMRRGELSGLQPYLPADSLAPPGAPVLLAGVPVHEQGPLARCAPFMDTAARRVLPGHLLRRARVLSSLQVGGTCLLRVTLTACTGEETVLVWKLALTALPGMQPVQQQPQQEAAQPTSQQQQHGAQYHQACNQHHQQQLDQPPQHPEPQQQQEQDQISAWTTTTNNSSNSSSSSSSSSGVGSGSSSGQPPAPSACWRVVSISQEGYSEEQQELPASPHPRVPPELIVRAQLQALRQQQLLRACGFNLMGRHASSSGWEAHLTAFRQLLQQEHYRLLGEHAVAELGASALPSQRQFLQEVVLTGLGGSSSSSSGGVGSGSGSSSSAGVSGKEGERSGSGKFLWRLGMQADGCWMVRSIEVL